MAYYLNFIQFWCILFTFAFAFGAFWSWLQNFGLVQTVSKFWYFETGDGKSWKSQYHSYLVHGKAGYITWQSETPWCSALDCPIHITNTRPEWTNFFIVILNVIMLCVVMLNVVMLYVTVMLKVVTLNVIMLNVVMLNVVMLSVIKLSITFLIVMLNVIMLSAVILNVVMPNVILLIVVAFL